jgi:hypothetical protein
MTEAGRKLNRGNDVPRLDLRRRRDRAGQVGQAGRDGQGRALAYFSIPFAIVCNCMLLVPS